MIRIIAVEDLEEIYNYQMTFSSPFFLTKDYQAWKESFTEDVDGEGRTLFKKLFVKAAYEEKKLVGFIQYGNTAFGFDNQGEISSEISYPVIRNFYFDKGRSDAGVLLLKEATKAFETAERVYAFFHYFGMSCFARHGKLFEQHRHIEEMLKDNGFELEHENVYYSSVLKGNVESDVEVKPHDMTKGKQQYIDFMLAENHVGGCEIHFIDDATAYLRWIYVNDGITGKGIGTKCMKALKQWLYEKGIRRFDTDTAITNTVAQHYYEKNGFVREGVTRSFF